MSDRRDPGTPPPFPGRDHYRSRPAGGADWQRDYLGKRPEQSWADFFGVGRGCRRRRTADWMGPAPGGVGGPTGTTEDGMTMTGGSSNPYRLYRSRTDSKIGGVCGGIAAYANIDTWIVRVGFIIGFFTFPPVFFFGYLVLWWLLKVQPTHLYESQEEEVFWRSVATKPDQTLSSLRGKFRDLDRDIGRLEGFVASREYDLHRQFRDLEKK